MGWRTTGVMTLAWVVASACTPSQEPASGRSEPSGSPVTQQRPSAQPLTEVWGSSAITPIGQPVSAGENVVVYSTEGERLFLYGVSVADGTVRWRQEATPSAVPTGIAVTPTVHEGRVVYYRPDASARLAGRLVVAAPDTGADILVSGPARFRAPPRTCDGGVDICVVAEESGGLSTTMRFSLAAGGQVANTAATPPGSRYVGTDLLDLGIRPDVFAGFSDGSVRWESPIGQHFPLFFSSDYGWQFRLYESAGVHVGSVGRPPLLDDGTVVHVNLAAARTVGISATDGSSRWREDATSFACQGQVTVERRLPDADSEAWPVRCRYRGTARHDRASGTTAYTDLDVVIEGFDVRSGRTTWSVPLGAAETFLAGRRDATEVSGEEVLVQAAAGPVVVHLGDGTTRRPASEEVFWCGREPETFEYRETYVAQGRSTNTWRGGTLLNPCTADGGATISLPTQLAPSHGATVGSRTVIATDKGLVAYERGG